VAEGADVSTWSGKLTDEVVISDHVAEQPTVVTWSVLYTPAWHPGPRCVSCPLIAHDTETALAYHWPVHGSLEPPTAQTAASVPDCALAAPASAAVTAIAAAQPTMARRILTPS
jgi:hypothetical protein